MDFGVLPFSWQVKDRKLPRSGVIQSSPEPKFPRQRGALNADLDIREAHHTEILCMQMFQTTGEPSFISGAQAMRKR
jgi:hypothetical protein